MGVVVPPWLPIAVWYPLATALLLAGTMVALVATLLCGASLMVAFGPLSLVVLALIAYNPYYALWFVIGLFTGLGCARRTTMRPRSDEKVALEADAT